MRKWESPHSQSGDLSAVALTVDGVSLRTGENAACVRDGSMALQPGTLTLVIGPNGAGKSVFLEKVAGLRSPERLTIRYGDEPLWVKSGWRGKPRLNPRALLLYGYAGQSPEQGLFQRTVGDELAYSLKPFKRIASDQDGAWRFHQALEAVGWNSSWLARDPFRMSGGEKRRAALASLFVTPAPWMLLDEPTAGLDRDGHEKLAAYLTALKREGRGVLLVSHDADWALPLADRVLLLSPGGEIADCFPDDLIDCPEWLERVGIEVPLWLRIVSRLKLSRSCGNGGFDWRHPSDVADALTGNTGGRFELVGLIGSEPKRDPASHPYRRESGAKPHPLTSFDPRSIWLAYVFLAAGLFTLSTWAGLLGGAALVGVLLRAGRIPLLRWKGLIAGFAVFGTALAGLAAIRWQGDGGFPLNWDAETFAGTLFPFARTLIVLLIGLGVPLVLTPLSLRRALEQLVARRRRVPAFWQRIVLTVTLTIRFVPVLLAEWERFGRIHLARGKQTGKSPISAIRRLRGIALPMLLSLFRLADDVAIALESRGVSKHARPTRGSRLTWRWRDTAVAASAAALAGVLWLLD